MPRALARTRAIEMAKTSETPDGLARRVFVFAVVGVAAYVAAVVLLMSSPADKSGADNASAQGQLTRR